MSEHVSGTFDVTMGKEPPHAAAVAAGLGRMTLAKRYHGALDATGVGEMLAAGTTTPGSAGYVAIECVDGTLDGRAGSFFLQHSGTLSRGAPTLSVTVIPDSGSGELTGLSGRLAIRIEGGKHYYDFDYAIDEQPGVVRA